MRGTYIFIYMLAFSFGACVENKKDVNNKPLGQVSEQSPGKKTDPGKIVYMQLCMACHMQNGEGVPGLYPPLVQTESVLGDKEKLIGIVLNGQQGPIVVNGENYNNIMAKLDYLSDQQIADVLTFVRSNFGNDAGPILASEVNKVRVNNSK